MLGVSRVQDAETVQLEQLCQTQPNVIAVVYDKDDSTVRNGRSQLEANRDSRLRFVAERGHLCHSGLPWAGDSRMSTMRARPLLFSDMSRFERTSLGYGLNQRRGDGRREAARDQNEPAIWLFFHDE